MQFQTIFQINIKTHRYIKSWFIPFFLIPIFSLSHAEILGKNSLTKQDEKIIIQQSQNIKYNDIQPVKVTARQSEELFKEIPFGISVLDKIDIDNGHLETLGDILNTVPSVTTFSNGDPNSVNVFIRGIGSIHHAGIDDRSVALRIDGVNVPSHNMSLDALDVEQIEILKGPQSPIFFGGNSTAGAVNITTNRPTRLQEGYISGQYGLNNKYFEEAILNAPFSNNLRGRFAIRHIEENHWINNIQSGRAMTKPSNTAMRGSLLWEINNNTNALLIMEEQVIKRHPNTTMLSPYKNSPILDMLPGVHDNDHKTVDRYSIEFNHNIKNSKITLTSAYIASDYDATAVYDRRIVQTLYDFPDEIMRKDLSRQQSLTQDLRWSSLPGQHIFWVTGLNLAHSEHTFDSRNLIKNDFDTRTYKNNSYSVYGEITYPLNSVLKFTTGLRQAWEDKKYDARYVKNNILADHRKLINNFTTGRVALSYALTPATNFYSVLSRGYGVGGFSDLTTQIIDSFPYQSAKSNTLEIGLKSEINNSRHFTFNSALFFNKIKDSHFIGYDYINFSTNIINANIKSKGIEFDSIWHLNKNTKLSGSLSYIDTTILSKSVNNSVGFITVGNHTPNIPRWSGNITLSYHKPLSLSKLMIKTVKPTELKTKLSYKYIGTRPADAQNHLNFNSYQKIDAHIGLAAGNTEIYLYGNNLLNKTYDLYSYCNNEIAMLGAPLRGRTIGIGFKYIF